jgi:hypothetical protein
LVGGDALYGNIQEAATHLKSADSYGEFKEAIKTSNSLHPLNDYLFDPLSYARYYCELDCEVLLRGFVRNRRETARILCFPDGREDGVPCLLDSFNAVSCSQIASHLLKKSQCFEGTYNLSGSVRDYVASAVVGGRVMVRANIPHKCEKEIDDLDACSLYPSAMARMAGELGGFPVGLPKVWTSDVDLNDPTIHYYVITVQITKVDKHLHFPILSYMDTFGGRHFSNIIVGKHITMDKVTWEDAQKFQGIEGELVCGIYFNEGGNAKIGKMIRYLYESRKVLKRMGNKPGEQVRKLMMNSSYGRTIMKPIPTEMVFISGKQKIKDYIYKHSVTIKVISQVREDFAIVERFHSLYNHLSQPQVGAFILSMSKRIMNEVICLAEDIKAPIHYQDTDSMHIEKRFIPSLGQAFFDRYKRPLLAAPGKKNLKEYEYGDDDLGLFHGDFEGVRGWEPPTSVLSVFCGKKMYMDRLKMTKKAKEGEEIETIFKNHIRFKGVPSDAITTHVKDDESIDTVYDLYVSILNGERYAIDLLKSNRPFFESKKHTMKTSTKKKFIREIGLIHYQRDRAIAEAKISNFDLHSMEY